MNSFRFNRKLYGIWWFAEQCRRIWLIPGPEKGQAGKNLFQIAGISTRAALHIQFGSRNTKVQSLEGSFGGEAIESVCVCVGRRRNCVIRAYGDCKGAANRCLPASIRSYLLFQFKIRQLCAAAVSQRSPLVNERQRKDERRAVKMQIINKWKFRPKLDICPLLGQAASI